ncbi:MAG: glycoside hydrolase 100 family protein [Pseudomonadota bacterium]
MTRREPEATDSGEILIETCTTRALQLLRDNLGPFGFLAASPTSSAHSRGYDRVFGRDAAICAIAAAYCDDDGLAQGAKRSLITLAQHQAPNGQIPKYVDPATNGADFWYLGCIDATLWWLIALHLVSRRLDDTDLVRRLEAETARATLWLACQEHQQIFLLQQNEASDWADIMPRSGFVLYTNALWYYVKRLHQLPQAEETKYHFNCLFDPFSGHLPDYRRLRLLMHFVRNKAKNRGIYLSFVNLAVWGEEGDVFGNLLATLLGLADEHGTNRILRTIGNLQADAAYPVRVTCTPIGRDNPFWRTYMGRHRQNLEHRYHNGGIWPFVGGFWVLALAAAGRRLEAQAELAKLARANAVNHWQFNEWFHGQNGTPEGMPRQTWNAAMFLLARQGLDQRIF